MLLANWFETFTTRLLGSRRISRRQKRGLSRLQKARRNRRTVSPALESLEDRTLLSTISWVNRGGSDGFTSVFGTALIDTNNDGTPDTQRDTVARRVVDATIDAWERVIEDFNFNDGTNTFRLTVNMATTGTGISASAGPTATDPVTGGATAGSMTIQRGLDADGDSLGDGWGWFLDVTPEDNSEFLGNIVNAFTGNGQFGSPIWVPVDSDGDGLGDDLDGDGNIDVQFDFYTPVAHELGHALGFVNSAQITNLSTLAPQVDTVDGRTGADTDGDGNPDGPFAGLWVFNGPSVQTLLTGYNSGNPPTDRGAPLHSAPAGANAFVLDSQGQVVTYNGATDLMTPFFGNGQRKLVPYTAALVLKDAYGYTVNNPAEFGTFYASLNETTGELLIRGGTGNSDDVITITEDGSDLVVSVNIGNDVPGTGATSGTEDLPAFVSRFWKLDVDSINIQAGDGNDTIVINNIPTFVEATIDGGTGNDSITVSNISAFAPTTIRGNAGEDTITIGAVDSFSPLLIDGGDNEDFFIFRGDLDDDIRSDVTVRGGFGPDTLIIHDRDPDEGLDKYTLTSNRLSKPGWLDAIEFSSISKLNLTTSNFADEINVESTSYALELNASGGGDTVNIGNGDYDFNIRGSIFISGGDLGRDVVNIQDAADTGDDDYTIEAIEVGTGSFAVTQTVFSKSSSTFDLTISRFEEIEVDANNGNNDISIQGVAEGTALTVNANDGNDRVFLGDDDYDSNILSPVRLNAGEGEDKLILEDRDDGGSDRYILDSHEFTKESAGVANVPVTTFSQFTEVTLHASDLGSTFDVNRIAFGVLTTINGRGGSDEFHVAGGDFDTRIQGDLRINGGTGTDNLIINDENDTGNDDYIFSAEGLLANVGTFIKTSTVLLVSILRFDDLDSVELRGSNGDNVFTIDRMQPATDYRLFGNGGVDEFRVDVTGQVSDIFISGGPPSTAPGDALYITGIGLHTASYTPDLLDPSGGRITTSTIFSPGSIRNTITFTGLEPVYLDGFDTVTMVTPRSYDLITVAPDADGWSKIDGGSGHPGLLLPFEELYFRDVPNVILDTAARDATSFSFPPGSPNPIIYPPFPNDQVTIQAGALDARGLESFSVMTGAGFNQVFNNTLTGPIASPTALLVDGAGGVTQVFNYGSAARGDVQQFAGFQTEFAAFDENGQLLHTGGYNFVELLVLPNRWDYFRAIGEDVDRHFRGTTSQIIEGTGLTQVSVAPTSEGGELEIVALGTSRIDLRGILFAETAISGLLDAGPQPEPPVSPDNVTVAIDSGFWSLPGVVPPFARVVGFGVEDQFNLESATLANGAPLPTDFALTFDASDNEKIELLVHTGGQIERVQFTIETGVMGAGPGLGFIGDEAVRNEVKAVRGIVIDPGMIMPVPIDLRNVELLTVVGSADDEGVFVETMAGGGLRVDSVHLQDIGRDLYFTSDAALTEVRSDAGDGLDLFEVQYPEPDFRNFQTSLSGVEAVGAIADPTTAILIGLLRPVRQSITPTSGTIDTGNLLLTHDDAVSTTLLGAAKLDVEVTRDATTDTFTRDLTLRYGYVGSEGTFAISDVRFGGNFEMSVEHKDGADNTTVIQTNDVVYEQSSMITVVGGEEGEDRVLITKTGVEAKQGSKIEVQSKSGKSFVVVTETDSGSADGQTDEVLMTGTGDPESDANIKTLLYHKQRDTTADFQLEDLKFEKPEYADQIDFLKVKAKKESLESTAESAVEGGKKRVVYQGEKTSVDVFIKNADEDVVETVVTNSGDTTDVDVVGGVTITVPELEGTGIDPTQPFTAFAVVNTRDSGVGSLRWAIESANAWKGDALPVVSFRIPTTDPNFVDVDSHRADGDIEPDVFQISPLSALPSLVRGAIVINGQSQQVITGDTNPFGPEIVLNGANASSATEIEGLISLYRFNGTTHDDIGDNQPFQTAGIAYVDGQIGGGISLAPGGYVDIPHTSELAQQVFSVSAWVRPDGPGPNNDEFGSTIIQKSISNVKTSFKLSWSALSQKFLLVSGDIRHEANITYSADTFAPGEFYHVAATFDGTVFRLFVNGEFQGENTRNSAIDYNPSIPWTIGSTAADFRDRPGQPNFPRTWNGVIDEVGIYNRALTSEEITQLAADTNGLDIDSDGNIVHGLNIQDFSGSGIDIDGDANTLTGNFIGTIATGGGVQPAIPATVGWWQGEGSAEDVTGQHNGTLERGTSFAPGLVGQAFEFDGVDDYIDVGPGFHLDAMTLEAWVFIDPLTNRGERRVISKDNFSTGGTRKAFALKTSSPFVSGQHGHATFTVQVDHVTGPDDLNIDAIESPTPLTAGWHHVAGVRDTAAGRFELYVDGVLVASKTPTAIGVIDSGVNTVIGNVNNLTSIEHFNGLIDEPAIFSRALSTVEIEAIFENDSAGKETVDYGNGKHGVHVVNANRNVIGDGRRDGGNLISGNQLGGIVIEGGLKNRIQGNTVGLTSDGQALGNSAGVTLTNTTDTLVGGDGKFDRNVISASRTGHGVLIQGRSATGNQIVGNFIGLDPTGTQARGNAQMGVIIADSSGHTIRSNAVSDNLNGIYLVGQTTADNVIENNRVGTTAAGTEAIGNRLHGIFLLQAQNTLVSENLVSGQEIGFGIVTAQSSRENLILNNRIGTTADGLSPLGNQVGVGLTGQSDRLIGNLISGNLRHGVSIDADFAGDGRGTGHVVQGNWIGVAADGVSPLGNGTVGIQIIELAANNVIGTDGDGINDNLEGNIIAYNRGVGVAVSDGSVSNPIRGNSIYANGDLGIALGPALGVSPNDPLDTDGGGNLQQNFPVIEQTLFNRELSVRGRLSAAPLTEYILDFYANLEADPSGHGEGRIWLGSLKVRTGEIDKKTGEAIAAFRFVHSFEEFAAVQFITTTATDPFGNTSEFSNVAPIEIPGPKPEPGGNLTAATAETQENLISPSLSGTDALEVESSTSNQERAISPSGAAASTVSPEPKTEDELLSWSVEPVESSPNSEWDALFADFDLQLGDELLTIL